eukprot:Skav229430  [mRNA]  locus=scaffold2297:381639:382319:+ [translate_table: standard]
MILGHRLDVQFSAGHDALSATWRAVRQRGTGLRDWGQRNGPAWRIAKWLEGLGWASDVPWLWKHQDLEQTVCLDPNSPQWCGDLKRVQHAVRESWRRLRWHSYISSKRHEVDQFQGLLYDEKRCRRLRSIVKTANTHEVAVLCGAFVSPLLLHKANPTYSPRCHACQNAVGSFDHVAWACPRNLNQPTQWHDRLEHRLGWPAVGGTTEVLRHLGGVRKAVLASRRD